MSAREFKPGDVAVNATFGYRGIFVADCPLHSRKGCWHNESGHSDNGNDHRRLLVVIDPEGNPEGLPYLVPQHFRNYATVLRKHHGPVSAQMLEWLADRLEECDPKPRIEEPTGLGAVVEDDSGRRWVRGPSHNTFKWLREGAPGCEEWADVNAVRVLHKGVTS